MSEDKIYVISCDQDLAAIGLNRMRTKIEGMRPIEMNVDWSKAKLIPVVAAEKVQFEEGEAKMIAIRPIEVPANAIVLDSFYGSNGMGHLTCIGSTEMKPNYEPRTANVGIFQSRLKAPVMENDLLGMSLVVEGKPV